MGNGAARTIFFDCCDAGPRTQCEQRRSNEYLISDQWLRQVFRIIEQHGPVHVVSMDRDEFRYGCKRPELQSIAADIALLQVGNSYDQCISFPSARGET